MSVLEQVGVIHCVPEMRFYFLFSSQKSGAAYICLNTVSRHVLPVNIFYSLHKQNFTAPSLKEFGGPLCMWRIPGPHHGSFSSLSCRNMMFEICADEKFRCKGFDCFTRNLAPANFRPKTIHSI
jgi:hypothetical protein